MGVMATKKTAWLEESNWRFHFKSLTSLLCQIGATYPEMAEACGVSVETFMHWTSRQSLPRGYNRRRDVLRDLARFVALKAGEA